jgi:hypothetical protein
MRVVCHCRRSTVLVAGGGAAAWLVAGGLVAAGAAAASGLFGSDNPQQLVRTGMNKFRQVSGAGLGNQPEGMRNYEMASCCTCLVGRRYN